MLGEELHASLSTGTAHTCLKGEDVFLLTLAVTFDLLL